MRIKDARELMMRLPASVLAGDEVAAHSGSFLYMISSRSVAKTSEQSHPLALAEATTSAGLPTLPWETAFGRCR